MGKNSITCRISPTLNAKIKAQKKKMEKFMGVKITYVQASKMVADKVRL